MRSRRKLLTTFVLLTLCAGLLATAAPAQALGKDVQQRILRASVKLMTPFDADKNQGSLCSGTMLSAEGYILTNFHCVGYVAGERDRTLESMGLRQGDFYNKQRLSLIAITDNPRQLPTPTYVAQVLSASAELDLAVMKIVSYANSKQALPKTLPVVYAAIADSDMVETLDEVFVIGYPGIGGDTVTATEGKISGFMDENEDKVIDWFKTDVLVNQGNSGGTAVNDRGELIGVPTARLQDKSGNIIYLIRPVNHAVPLIQRALKAGGSTGDLGRAAPAAVAPQVTGNQNIGALTFGTGFNNGVTGAATTFKAGVLEVHAGVPYQNMGDGAPWAYSWQLDGKEVSGQQNLSWSFGQSGVLDLYLKSKSGLPEGSYNLQVSLQGRVAQEGQFVVGSAKPANTPQKPARSQAQDVTVSGTVLDSSTRRPIQGAAIIFLIPGKTVDDFDNDDSKGKADTVASYGITNASGAFTIETPLARGETYSVIVGAKGYRRIAEDDALPIEDSDPDLLELDPIELDRQ
jgi:S1-C subfamily serine protease